MLSPRKFLSSTPTPRLIKWIPSLLFFFFSFQFGNKLPNKIFSQTSSYHHPAITFLPNYQRLDSNEEDVFKQAIEKLKKKGAALEPADGRILEKIISWPVDYRFPGSDLIFFKKEEEEEEE